MASQLVQVQICYKFARVYDSLDEKDKDLTAYKKLYWKTIEDRKDMLYSLHNYSNKTKVQKIQKLLDKDKKLDIQKKELLKDAIRSALNI
jgi:hypothetical protein